MPSFPSTQPWSRHFLLLGSLALLTHCFPFPPSLPPLFLPNIFVRIFFARSILFRIFLSFLLFFFFPTFFPFQFFPQTLITLTVPLSCGWKFTTNPFSIQLIYRKGGTSPHLKFPNSSHKKSSARRFSSSLSNKIIITPKQHHPWTPGQPWSLPTQIKRQNSLYPSRPHKFFSWSLLNHPHNYTWAFPLYPLHPFSPQITQYLLPVEIPVLQHWHILAFKLALYYYNCLIPGDSCCFEIIIFLYTSCNCF